MKQEDFYKLHISQKIWWRGEDKEIEVLKAYTYGGNSEIEFFADPHEYKWNVICEDCSLEAPKEKRSWIVCRYWFCDKNSPTLHTSDWCYINTWESYIYINKSFNECDLIKTETKMITED